MAISAVFILSSSLAICFWYWGWGKSHSLDELNPNRIPTEYRFEEQPRELVAVLTTKSAFVGCVGVAFHPDGKRLAGGFGSGEIVVWDAGNLKEVAVLKGHKLPVSSLIFTPDGKTLISGSYDGTIRLWDVAGWTPREQAALRGHTDQVWTLALSPDGSLLASGSTDKTIRLWGLRFNPPQVGSVVNLAGWPVYSVSIASNGQTLACGRHDCIQLRDLGDKELTIKTVVDGHTGSVWRVTFAPGGKMLASCGRDKIVRLWELDGDKLRFRAELHGHASIDLYGLAFSPDGKQLVSADQDGRVIIWDVDDRSELTRWQLPYGPRGVVFAPDGHHLAISTNKSIVCILRLPR
jgi:WD40 repeat protein